MFSRKIFSQPLRLLTTSSLWHQNQEPPKLLLVEDAIKVILEREYEPKYLNIINQSKMHSKGDQTHFKVIMVSDKVNQIKGRVKKHQTVLKSTKPLLNETTLHSISFALPETINDALPEELKISPTCANHKN